MKRLLLSLILVGLTVYPLLGQCDIDVELLSVNYSDNDTPNCEDDLVQIEWSLIDRSDRNLNYQLRDQFNNVYTGQFGDTLSTVPYPFRVRNILLEVEEPCERNLEITDLWQSHTCELDLAFTLPDTILACQETEICVPVEAQGFQNIRSLQFSINYDPTILRYIGTKNEVLVTPLPIISVIQVANPSPGNLTLRWHSPHSDAVDLPIIIKLLDLRFRPLQPGISQISFSGSPSVIEVIDGEEEEVIPNFSNTQVEISCPEDECAIFVDYTIGSINDNATTRCDDDFVPIEISATSVGPASTDYEILLDSVIIGRYPVGTTTNVHYPADSRNHTLIVRDTDNPDCMHSYVLARRGFCRTCEITVESQRTEYDDFGTTDDVTDDLLYVSLRVSNTGNRSDNWTYTYGNGVEVYPYNQEITLPPLPICAPAILQIADEEVPNCDLRIDLSQAFSARFSNRIIESNGTNTLCTDDSVYYRIEIRNESSTENFEWFGIDNFGTIFRGNDGFHRIGPYSITANIDQIELNVYSNVSTSCINLLLDNNFPTCQIDLSLDVNQVNFTNPFELEIQLANQSTTPASNIVIQAPLPTLAEFVASDGNYNATTGLWQLDELTPRSDTTLRIRFLTNSLGGDSLFLAEIIHADQPDSDSAPANGIDTDGDGHVVDDNEDEDDGDGLVLCTVIANTLTISNDTTCAGQPIDWSFAENQPIPNGYGAFVGIYPSTTTQIEDALTWFRDGVIEQASFLSNTTYWLRTVIAPLNNGNTPLFGDACVATGPLQPITWIQPTIDNCIEEGITCIQSTITLGCEVSGQMPIQYRWIRDGLFISDNAELSINQGGLYSLQVIDANGCFNEESFFITEDLAPLNVSIRIQSGDLCQPDDPLRIFASTSSLGNNYLWSNGATTRSITITETGVYQVTVTNSLTGCTGNAEVTIDDIPETQVCNELSGFVKLTENCQIGEAGLAGWFIIARNDSYFRATSSESDGAYHLDLPRGTFQVILVPPSPVWEVCENPYVINFSGYGESQTSDLLAQKVDNCPLLSVDVALPALRPCRSDRLVYLHYRNVGTDTLYNGLIAVILPDQLAFIETNGELIEQRGDTLFFAAHTPLYPGERGQFWIRPEVSCQAEVGTALCVRALGLPYGPCPEPSADWSGASLAINAYCEGEEVRFEVRNAGDQAMPERGHYVVIQDIVMLMEGAETFDPLTAGEAIDFRFPANGATYRMEVEQTTNHPGLSHPSVSIEGCGTDAGGQISTGIVTQYPFDDADYHVDEDCQEVTNAYDPNDKQAEPRGYAEQHYIEPNQKLEYTIRFQNTGTDTAFQVVIRDTLSEWLDFTTFRPGASSHLYRLSLDSAQQISFVFDDILLPDSTTNEEASQGFVSFQIHPVSDIPLETIITNQAAIYFDFNPPIFTNTAFHTVGRNFLQIVNWEDQAPYTVDWQYYPNPGSTNLSVKVDGQPDWPLQLRLQTINGQANSTYTIDGPHTTLQLANLPKGVYIVDLHDSKGQLLGQGKWVKL